MLRCWAAIDSAVARRRALRPESASGASTSAVVGLSGREAASLEELLFSFLEDFFLLRRRRFRETVGKTGHSFFRSAVRRLLANLSKSNNWGIWGELYRFDATGYRRFLWVVPRDAIFDSVAVGKAP
jgi:hypothetical protein